ncbi:TonB-dependent receptor [Undibacterium sp. KW1]|nr:TonB-dependent receptor [Undibacterium sp. KW1]
MHAENQNEASQGNNADSRTETATDANISTVSITGIRSSIKRNIAAKRDSVLTIDTTASDDIGKLPDFNVGDALKRVTGVNTLLYQGEPRFAIVRGLNANYNATQIDGFSLASADVGGRQMLMELFPSNFVNRIDVTKSFIAEADGAAIGGVVNMLTASGLSYPENTFNFSAKLGANLMSSQYGGKTPVGEAQAVWAKRLGSSNDLGLLITGSYWSRDINVPQIEHGGALNWYNNAGALSSTPYSGNGVAVPTERRWYNYDNSRSRIGLTARIDWEPEGALSGHVSTYFFKQKETSNRNMQLATVNGNSVVLNQTPTNGTLSSVNQIVELGQLQFDRALFGINGELKYEISPLLVADVRGSLSRSTVNNPQTWDRFQQTNQSYNYDWSNPLVSFSPVNVANASDASKYALVYHRNENMSDYAENVYDAQSNLRFNMGEASRGWGFATGVRAVSTDSNTALIRTTFAGMPYNLSNVVSGASNCGLNCNSPLIIIDQNKAGTLFSQYQGGATATVDTAGQYGGTYGIREDVTAAYIQGQYRTDRFMLAGGLRFEHTDFRSTGFQSVGGVFSPTSSEQSYQNLLPSLTGNFETSTTSKFRLGLSQTIGRPRFDQIATHGGALVSNGSTYTLSQGNPDLKPRRSNNFDLGHEWYLDGERGIFSVAAFYKEIRDEIFTYGQVQTISINGTSTPVLVTKARNATSVANLAGIEIGFSKDLDFLSPSLSGFGVSANATFSRASFPVTLSDGTNRALNVLPQQPKEIWNIAIFYEKGGVHAKLAWNHLGKLWDDRFPNFTPTGFYANRYQQATNSIDLQTSYDVNKKLSLSLNVLNITGNGIQDNYGNSQEYVQSAIKYAPTVLFGLNYKM